MPPRKRAHPPSKRARERRYFLSNLEVALAAVVAAGTFAAGFYLGQNAECSAILPGPSEPAGASTGACDCNGSGASASDCKPLEPANATVPAVKAQQLWKGSHTNACQERTLSFQVCNGFANQRVSLVTGILIGAELNRTVVLPRVLLDGTQPTEEEINEESSDSVSFGDMFDTDFFAERLALHSVNIRLSSELPAQAVAVQAHSHHDIVSVLNSTYAAEQHIRLDCPLFRAPPELITRRAQLVFDILDAMQPSSRLMSILQRVEAELHELSSTKGYNVLHLRAEDDWVAHCKRWRTRGDGIVRDNCMNNTRTVGQQLVFHGVDPKVPLLLATSWAQADKELATDAMANLKAHNYTVVTRHMLLKNDGLSREESALIDYYLGLNCQQFVGNSVSTFSALLIMERWNAGRYATYYNGGNIPLELFLPLYKMPWVFTYNDWSSGTEYDMMLKAAVRSALDVARLKPFCLYSGRTDLPMVRWLVDAGVTIIQHAPSWKERLLRIAENNRADNAKVHSYLYATDGSIVGTFQRIDIPVLREFEQYHYILFTDCDVFFTKQIKLVDWGVPLHTAAGMAYDLDDRFPYNAGVMLMNVPFLRATHEAFVEWILSQHNGLWYEGYGPVDQGAYNQFYETDIRGCPISKDFNTKPYQKLQPNACIVHFHGPKPNHYLDWLLNGNCKFGGICEAGFMHALCDYMIDYAKHIKEWDVAVTLRMLCTDGKGLIHARLQWADLKHI